MKLSGGNRLAGCVYVCVAKFASFFHERYLVVFACKAVFAQKIVSLNILQKRLSLKEVILQDLARILQDLLKRCILFKRILQDSC